MPPRPSTYSSDRTADDHETPPLSPPPALNAGKLLPSKQAYTLSPDNVPLIDRITNEWRHNANDSDDAEDLDGYEPARRERHWWSEAKPPKWLSSLSGSGCHRKVPRRVQRWVMIYLVLTVLTVLVWIYFIRPAWVERSQIKWSLDPANKDVFGGNMMPDFQDLIKVKKLDSHLLPAVGEEGKRLIFIGDVHGCKEELVELLKTLKYHSSTDHIIFTGDLISKGPDSIGVVRLARDLKASCVRGNHEDRMLTALQNMQDEQHAATLREAAGQQHFNVSDELHGDERARQLASTFSPSDIAWLKACPVILHVGPIPGMGDVLVVHGGLAPGHPLTQQDPSLVMNMRTIDTVTGVPSEERDGTPWTKVWNYKQSQLPHKERATVIYGHDSRRGLRIHPWSKGLDTGCVGGERLTALVVSADRKSREVTQELVNVRCKNWKQMMKEDARLGGN